MEVGRLPISAALKGKLVSAGYTSLSLLSSLSPSHLARGTPSPIDPPFHSRLDHCNVAILPSRGRPFHGVQSVVLSFVWEVAVPGARVGLEFDLSGASKLLGISAISALASGAVLFDLILCWVVRILLPAVER